MVVLKIANSNHSMWKRSLRDYLLWDYLPFSYFLGETEINMWRLKNVLDKYCSPNGRSWIATYEWMRKVIRYQLAIIFPSGGRVVGEPSLLCNFHFVIFKLRHFAIEF